MSSVTAGASASGAAPAAGASPAPAASTSNSPSPRSKDSRVTNDPPAGKGEGTPAAPDFKGTKHKVKVDEQELEVDYEELTRGYQKTQAAQRRFQEASRMAAEAKKVEQALEAGDVKFLVAKMGPEKARQVFENYLIEQMEYESLPQHERDLRTERQRREDLEKKLAERDQSDEQSRYQAISDQAYQDLDVEISEALNSVGKAASPRMALRIIEEIEARGLDEKGQRIPASKALEHAQASIRQDIQAYCEDLSPEEAFKVFPKSFLDRLMKARVDGVIDTRGQRRQAPQGTAPKAEAPKKARSIDDAFEEISSKLKRGR